MKTRLTERSERKSLSEFDPPPLFDEALNLDTRVDFAITPYL
jgi:hypothetical protein